LNENSDYPVVCCFHSISSDWSRESCPVSCVVYDDANGVREALEWLHARGGCKIVYISKDNDNLNVQSRKEAYLSFMEEKNLVPVLLDGNKNVAEEKIGESASAAQVKRARALLRNHLLSGHPIPDAVLATSDEYAFGACDELKRQGVSIHEQCVVVGFNNSDLADLTDPPIHSISKPLRESGVVAVRLLKKLALGGKPEKIVLKSRFIPKDEKQENEK
jgi:DNA-binding LacI/PurR family transcriptional regulator